MLRWYVSTQGETSLNQLTYIGHDRLFRRSEEGTLEEATSGSACRPGTALPGIAVILALYQVVE